MTSLKKLIADLCSSDESVREEVVSQLESFGAPPPELRVELTDRLADPKADSLQCYWCLTLLGRDANAATTAEASRIAQHLGAEKAIEVRQRAAWALGKLASVAAGTRTALAQAASDENPRLARLAQRALDSLKDS